ncbi:hypothetical protein KFL_013020010, partial [Klebsormidium nitens]
MDAGARVSFEKGVARFEMGGVVKMEAVQHGELWEIVTVKKAQAFVAVKGPAKTGFRFGEAARKPPVVAERKRMEVKPVEFIEVDLESDDESDDGPVKESQPIEASVGETMIAEHGTTEAWEPQQKAWEHGRT